MFKVGNVQKFISTGNAKTDTKIIIKYIIMNPEIEDTKKEIEKLQLKLQELERPTPEQSEEMKKRVDNMLKDI